MTGMELLEGMTFVDEKWIQEAESAVIGRNRPWMKVMSVAACLCIVVMSVFAAQRGLFRSAMETMGNISLSTDKSAAAEEPAAPITEAAEADAPMMDQAPGASAEEDRYGGELQQVPYARLRIVEVLEPGRFEAIVEADEPMEMDTRVILVVDSTKVPGAGAEVQNDLRAVHIDARIEIHDGAYDADSNTLYVAEVTFLCREDHE